MPPYLRALMPLGGGDRHRRGGCEVKAPPGASAPGGRSPGSLIEGGGGWEGQSLADRRKGTDRRGGAPGGRGRAGGLPPPGIYLIIYFNSLINLFCPRRESPVSFDDSPAEDMLALTGWMAEATGRRKKAPRPDRWQTGGSAASLHEQCSLSAEEIAILVVVKATTWASNLKRDPIPGA